MSTQVHATVSGQSTRPRDTAKPLANALGLTLQMPCDKVEKRRLDQLGNPKGVGGETHVYTVNIWSFP